MGLLERGGRLLLRPAAPERRRPRDPLQARSIVGLLPLTAVTTLPDELLSSRCPTSRTGWRWFIENRPEARGVVIQPAATARAAGRVDDALGHRERWTACAADARGDARPGRVPLRPRHPLALQAPRGAAPLVRSTSTASWRRSNTSPRSRPAICSAATRTGAGPVWMPINYILLQALRRHDEALGPDFKIECPTGSFRAAMHPRRGRSRAVGSPRSGSSSAARTAAGRSSAATRSRLQEDPAWRDLILFNEYFHGDTGAGLGASHQTGWTGLVAYLIIRKASGATEP